MGYQYPEDAFIELTNVQCSSLYNCTTNVI